jgi:hypothetical protein
MFWNWDFYGDALLFIALNVPERKYNRVAVIFEVIWLGEL